MAVRIESQAEPIPGYKLIERLGGGGFGEVWKAEAPGGLLKAIKFVYGDLQTAGDDGARAEQELKAMSRVKTVRHPYILSLERYDIIDGQLIIVMELADRNLWDRFKECKNDGLPGIPREELLRYMEESAEALDLMNIQYQLQHLDIKPHNIFLTHNHVKVADFGLVKDLEGMVASVTGGVTPVYAAPETFDGYVSRFCDQYSLAIVYQELLTGQRPFTGTNVRQLILQHLQAVPKLDSLPPGDRGAIAKALAKTPDERHRNCRDLVGCLRGESSVVRTPSPRPLAKADVEPAANPSPLTHPPSISAVPPPATGESAVHTAPLTPPSAKLQRPAPQETPGAEVTVCVRPNDSHKVNGSTPLAAVLLQNEPPPDAIPVAQAAAAVDAGEGTGILTPAVIIGLGQYGLHVLQHVRQEMQGRFGDAEAVGCVRLLYLDTDPDATRDALRGTGGAALSPNEVVLARLNRPSHYLKARDGRDGRVRVDGWLDTHMLYRIPRTQLTTGVRALGRLAFCDNYATIARRLREEFSHCADPETLAAADRATGLGVRRRRPRVYLVANLAGGTGSGMLLDVAYAVRNLLRPLGLGEPDVVGLCFLPPVDGNQGKVMGLGNTAAALTELSYYLDPARTFTARYEEKEGALRDAGPPFNRCLMLPLPEESDETAGNPAEPAADLLCRELFSPLGHAADQRRAELVPARPTREPACQAFGMIRFAFPRRELVRQVARQLCQRLVERWMSKDSKPLQAPVSAWVQEQWTTQELGGDAFIAALQDAVTRLLGKPTETLCAAALSPLTTPAEGETKPPTTIAPELAIDVLREIDQLVGRPEQDALNKQSGRLPEALSEASDVLVSQWGQRLTNVVVHLIEEPEFRLAGAEEAVRQVVARLERALENHEKLGEELAARAAEARVRLVAVLRTLPTLPSAKARAAASTELLELLRNYPKWRSQALLLQTAGRAFVSLRGNLSDQLREINFCRVRLGELAQAFAEGDSGSRGHWFDAPPAAGAARVRYLLPANCATPEQAVAHFARDITPEDLQALDRGVQTMITQQFRALKNICMTSANVLRNVQIAMEAEVASATETRMGATDAAALFFERYPRDDRAASELAAAFDEAAPDSPSAKSGAVRGELCLLAVPATPAGERLRALARQAVPDAPWVDASGGDEILLYREAPQVAITDLVQLGPIGQEAYAQMSAVEHFTPHTRIDVAFGREKATRT